MAFSSEMPNLQIECSHLLVLVCPLFVSYNSCFTNQNPFIKCIMPQLVTGEPCVFTMKFMAYPIEATGCSSLSLEHNSTHGCHHHDVQPPAGVLDLRYLGHYQHLIPCPQHLEFPSCLWSKYSLQFWNVYQSTQPTCISATILSIFRLANRWLEKTFTAEE